MSRTRIGVVGAGVIARHPARRTDRSSSPWAKGGTHSQTPSSPLARLWMPCRGRAENAALHSASPAEEPDAYRQACLSYRAVSPFIEKAARWVGNPSSGG